MLHHVSFYDDEVYAPSYSIDSLPPGLPTMEDIIEYCEKCPRVLTLRDSPLKDLQDPHVSIHTIHDWYTALSAKYIQTHTPKIIEFWNESIVAVETLEDRLELLSVTIDELYGVIQRVHRALNMPWTEESPMTSSDLKRRLQATFSEIVLPALPPSFTDTNRAYFDAIYTQYFAAWGAQDDAFDENDHVTPDNRDDNKHAPRRLAPCTLFFPYTGDRLEWILTHRLEVNLPETIRGPDMTDDQLELELQLLMDKCPWMDMDDNDATTSQATATRINLDAAPPDFSAAAISSTSDASELPAHFAERCQKCYAMGLSPPWLEMAREWLISRVTHGPLADEWSKHTLKLEMRYLQRTILPWLSHIFTTSLITQDLSPWLDFLRAKIRLEHILYGIFYESRCNSIFDILMTNYPGASPVFEDLHTIEERVLQPKSLTQAVRDSLQVRLLYRGASATDIMQQYLACIRYLKVFDPTCRALLPVQQQVEVYMKTYRQDTVDGVVEMIRNGEEYDLLDGSDTLYVFSEHEIDASLSIPLDDSAQLDRLQRMSGDLVAMLISLCGSISQFFQGYQRHLGRALLMGADYDTENEVMNLEIVKRHFPENKMTECDVMIKDVTEGKRLDRQIHDGIASSDIDFFHGVIMSRHYWPKSLLDNEGPADSSMLPTMETYQAQFSHVKQNRKLHWLPKQGAVTLELQFKGQVQEWTVHPSAAIIIQLFATDDNESSPRLSLAEIMEKSGFDTSTAIESLNFWHKRKILSLNACGLYSLLEPS
ncbi:hypothetical protein BC940DRAFT_290621 [Gongronella butleri]|nr:hypothetical protein BC940DRAFT_290621 [Gongronella butleri]